MKKKYLSKSNLQNGSDSTKYNLNLYCNLVAKKFGKKQEYVSNTLKNYFKFLDKKGILQLIPSKRINDNIKTLLIDYNFYYNTGAMAYYTSSENSITMRNNNSIMRYFMHEFNHMLSSTYRKIDKKQSISDETTQTMTQEKCGFHICDYIFDNIKTLTNLSCKNMSELCEYVYNNENYMVEYKLCAIDSYSKSNHEDATLLYYETPLELLSTNKELHKKRVLEELEEFFANDKFTEITISLNENTVAKIVKNGDKFVVTETKFEKDNSKNVTNNAIGITEGTTELLTTMFFNDLIKDDNISRIYPFEVKSAEMFYKIFGNSFFEGYFNNSITPMAKYLNIEEEEIANIISNVEAVYSAPVTYVDALYEINIQFIDLLQHKIFNDIIDHEVSSPISMQKMILKSVLDFSKSLNFGYEKLSLTYSDKTDVRAQLTDATNSIIDMLKEEVVFENGYEYKFVNAVNHLKYFDDAQLQEIYTNITYVNNNAYNFIEEELDEIKPIEFANDKGILLRDYNKQNYKRTNNKIMSIDDFENLYLDL